ncbi:MAG: hypothetical protein J3R72DRAFT_429982 [Linnemannia gamsii]|nr:MAG: hypothetical protein J3R72DRAFT_429982 [Linnemannia gamsii]
MKLHTANIVMTLTLGLCLTLSMIPTNCLATIDDCLQDSITYEIFQQCRAFEIMADEHQKIVDTEEYNQCLAGCKDLSTTCPTRTGRAPRRNCVTLHQRCLNACNAGP